MTPIAELPIMCPAIARDGPTWSPYFCGVAECRRLPTERTAWCAEHLRELRA